MTKRDLERRCAEMKAKYVALRNGATPTAPALPVRVAATRVPPQPAPSVISGSDFQIERPHPLVRNSRTGLRDVRKEYDILLQIGGPGRLDLTVSRAALPRALWIMDRFIKRFLAEGFQVEGKDGTAKVVVEGYPSGKDA